MTDNLYSVWLRALDLALIILHFGVTVYIVAMGTVIVILGPEFVTSLLFMAIAFISNALMDWGREDIYNKKQECKERQSSGQCEPDKKLYCLHTTVNTILMVIFIAGMGIVSQLDVLLKK